MNALIVLLLIFNAAENTYQEKNELPGKWAMYKTSTEGRLHYPLEPWQTDTLILDETSFVRKYRSIDKVYKIHDHIARGEYAIKSNKILFTALTRDGAPIPNEKFFLKFKDGELMVGMEIIPKTKEGERDYHSSIYKVWRHFKKMP